MSGDRDTGTPSHSDRTGDRFGHPRFRATQLETLWRQRFLGGLGLRLPTRVSPGSSALWTRTMPPGRAESTGYPPRGRETLTCRASGRSRWEMARAICPARRLEEAPEARRTGAACAELWSPARTAAAARRLQWSSAPQPLLSHGRGALAGRRSGLPAPGSGTPASPDRSRGLHGVPLCSHRAPFVRAPAPVSSLPGVRGNPLGYRDQTPDRLCPGEIGPPRVESSRGGSAGLERRGREMTAALRTWSGGRGLHRGTATWWPPLYETKPLALGALQRPHSTNKQYV